MSRFDDRFEKHGIHTILNNVLSINNELLEVENNQNEVILELERIKQICLLIKDALSNCDPNLVYIGYLDQIQNNYINNISSYLSQFRSDRSISHLHNANNQMDNVLPSLASILRPITPNDIEGVRKSIVSFRGSVTQHLRYTEEEYNKIEAIRQELEQGLNQVSSTVELQKSRLDTAIAEYQQQFSQAEEGRRVQFANFEEERRKINDKNELDWKSTYGKHESERTKSFNKLLDTWRQEFETSIKNFKVSSIEIHDDFSSQAKTYIDTLNGYKTQAAQSLNMISISSMAGGYKTVANQEGKSREFWRFNTMFTMTLLVVASIWSFFHPLGDGAIWSEVTRRVFVAVTIASLAGYSARQAKIHLDAERRYRKMELELTALNPYLAELEDTKRQEILAKMAELFFGRADVEKDSSDKSTSDNELSGNLNAVSKLLDSAHSIISNKK